MKILFNLQICSVMSSKTRPRSGHQVLKGGLPGVCLYEVLRQLQPALLKTGKSPQAARRQMPPIVRSELRQQQFAEQLMLWDHRLSWDPVPVNYVFTFSGLSAVGLDSTTLASFPDPFKQGMAARAERLGDTGPSAPKNWHGHLGLNSTGDSESIHGYFTGGFLVGDEKTPGAALLWAELAGRRGRLQRALRAERGRSQSPSQFSFSLVWGGDRSYRDRRKPLRTRSGRDSPAHALSQGALRIPGRRQPALRLSGAGDAFRPSVREEARPAPTGLGRRSPRARSISVKRTKTIASS